MHPSRQSEANDTRAVDGRALRETSGAPALETLRPAPPRVAQPNWERLGFAGEWDAASRN